MPLVQPGRRAPLESRALPDRLVRRVRTGPPVLREPLVLLDQLALQVQQVYRELPVRPVRRAPLESSVLPVRRVRTDPPVPRELLVLPGQMELLAQRVLQEQPVQPDPVVQSGLRDRPARQDLLAQLERMESLGQPVP